MLHIKDVPAIPSLPSVEHAKPDVQSRLLEVASSARLDPPADPLKLWHFISEP